MKIKKRTHLDNVVEDNSMLTCYKSVFLDNMLACVHPKAKMQSK